MSVYQKVTADFYNGITAGDIEVVEALIDDDFELIVPMSSGVLSGIYKGKKRFLEGVIPLVFSCVDPEQMIFCKNFKIISYERIINCDLFKGLILGVDPKLITYNQAKKIFLKKK